MTFVDREVAPAKINLALHVRARAPDGYHRIETLFVFAADGDLLEVAPGEGLDLSIIGPFAGSLSVAPDNLVLRAAEALRAAFGVRDGASLRLDKRLPVASGIGGGSADAAAALRLLGRFWGLPLHDPCFATISEALGADVPACLLSQTCRGEGRGDALDPIVAPELAGLPLLLVNPGVAVTTGPVFAGWDRIDRGALDKGAPLEAARVGRNDLQPPAVALQPVIADVLDLLAAQPGVILSRMSGSGATCFALFDDRAARDAADAAVAAACPGWWRMASVLR